MSKRLLSLWLELITRHAGRVCVVLIILTVLSTWAASRLTVNTNQLDLISQDLRQVKDVKRVNDMIGGIGHLIVALRGTDPELLQKVSDDLAKQFKADEENVREVTYRVAAEFLRLNGALFMETDDLIELKRRVMLKVRDVIKRANPFFMEIEETEPVKLDVDDLIDKYSRVGKRSIKTDYYLSDDNEMLLILLKPMWTHTEVGRTGPFLQQMREQFAAYSETNAHGVRLVEDYSTEPDPDATVMEFGFSGGYTTTHDDSNEIKSSIGPVSGFAFVGVFLVLLLFFRRHIIAVPLVIMGLVMGIILTLGFTWAAIGELNMITSILGGILMGLGIDFGIHMIYRLGEELGRGQTLEDALAETLANSGMASLVSGAGTAAAFFSLLFSEFAGFSQFGLLAGSGVMIIGVVLYLWVPVLLVLLERWRPGLPTRMLGGLVGGKDLTEASEARVKRPGVWLAVGAGVALLVTAFAPQVIFEYNTRALMVEHQPSVMLRDEIDKRYQISADPVAVYTPTREAAKEVYAVFTPLDQERHSTVDQMVSMFSMVPPPDQQERNYKILTDWNKELSEIDRESLPPEFQDKWDLAMKYLAAKPYDIDGVPQHLRQMFESIETARPENRGFLTFIYPVVDLWDGKQMLKYAEEVEEIPVDAGTFNAAGAPILFAKLAKIVLFDARFSVILTFFLLLGILLVDFRRVSSTLIALTPLALGVGVMLGAMTLLDVQLNFMNVVVFPIVLGYGLSHGVYLMHRFYEGSSPVQALRSVGTAVACSTLTTLAGWAALLAASHRGVKSMGMLACLGMTGTLLVTFTVMPAILQLLHDRRTGNSDSATAPSDDTAEVIS